LDDEIKASILNITNEQVILDNLINQWNCDVLKIEEQCTSDWDKKGKDIITKILNTIDVDDKPKLWYQQTKLNK
jgi:hypothetical protein